MLATPTPSEVWAWIAANQWLTVPVAIFLLSTLATALTKYPQASGFVTVLRLLLGRLSALQHSDSAATFSLPGLATKPPEGVAKLTMADAIKPPDQPPPLGFVPVQVLVGVTAICGVIAIALSASSCAALQSPLAWQAATGIAACAEHAVVEALPPLVAKVEAILAHSDDSTWAAELDALKADGEDALLCAIAAVVGALDNKGGSYVSVTTGRHFAEPAALTLAKATAVSRGKVYLQRSAK
jgi:hypothetical protein